ncbi:MFS transporter [Pseudomonas ogarae]|uniref:MFS transporter n=1 Tax=Pseudomonas ogarae (strain DSM 112162 / CECT 30235 / F113) TaxID=1114970 RepID=UPI00111603A4|nr:MFS transporter [Pseudomonas ogarae]
MNDNNDGLISSGCMQKIAALILPCLASLPIMVMPFIFGAVINILGVDSSSATFATSAEISMIALASLLVSLGLRFLSPRTTALIGLVVASLGHFISISSNSLELMFLARGLAGFGEGLCMGIGFATLAQIVGGTKLLAYSSGIVAALSLCSFQLVPILQPTLGQAAVFWFMLAVTSLCIPLVFWMPKNKLRQVQATNSLRAIFNARSLSLFFIAFLASAGSNTLWLYFEQAGGSVGLDLKSIGQLGSVILIPTLLVPFVVNFIFDRTKSILPIFIACVLSGVSAFYYAKFGSALLFSIVVISMAFLYVFLLAYIRVFSAHVDHTGRTTAAVGGADSLGMVIGPLIAALTLNLDGGFSPLSTLGLFMNLLCIIPCVFIVFARSTKAERSFG